MRKPGSRSFRPSTGARRDLVLLAFAATMLLVLIGPIMTIGDASLTGEGNPLRQWGYLAALLCVAGALKPWEAPRRLIAVPAPLLITLGICLASMAWAINPDIGGRRLILTAMVTWIASVCVTELGYTITTRFLRIVLLLALIANFAAVLIWPQFGIHQMNDRGDYQLLGDWRGFVMHKNAAGALCAVTLLLFVFDSKSLHWAIRTPIIGASIVFLFYARSRTSLGMAIAAVVAGFVYQRVSPRYRGWLIGLIFVGSLAAMTVAAMYSDPLARVMTDAKTLTGRPYIWTAMLAYSRDNWLLGAGFGSFWNIGPDSPVYQYGKDWITQIASAHNGFIELLVQLGLPLTIVVVGMLVVWPMIRLLASRSISSERGALLVAMLIFCVGHNLTETSFMDRDNIMSLFLIFAISLIWVTTKRAADGGGQDLFTSIAPRSRAPLV